MYISRTVDSDTIGTMLFINCRSVALLGENRIDQRATDPPILKALDLQRIFSAQV